MTHTFSTDADRIADTKRFKKKDNVIFCWVGTYRRRYGGMYGGMYGQGGDHMLTYHLSSFGTVRLDTGLGVQILFLRNEVQGKHGMTSWLPM